MPIKTIFLLICAAAFLPWGDSIPSAQHIDEENIPDEIAFEVGLGPFAQTFEIDGTINPFYLRGDFDGDGKADYAVRVVSKAHNDVGIAIWLSSQKRFVILGAGTPFKVSGQPSTHLEFLNTWQVFAKGPVEEGVDAGPPPHLIGDAILAGKRESASGLIFWNGKSFAWYQQGD